MPPSCSEFDVVCAALDGWGTKQCLGDIGHPCKNGEHCASRHCSASKCAAWTAEKTRDGLNKACYPGDAPGDATECDRWEGPHGQNKLLTCELVFGAGGSGQCMGAAGFPCWGIGSSKDCSQGLACVDVDGNGEQCEMPTLGDCTRAGGTTDSPCTRAGASKSL